MTLAVIAATGCAVTESQFVRGTPIAPEGCGRLSVEAHSLEDGSLSLRVFEANRTVVAQDLGPIEATRDNHEHLAVASVDVDLSGFNILSPVAAVVGVYYIVAYAIESLVHAISFICQALSPPENDQDSPAEDQDLPQGSTPPLPGIVHRPIRTVILVPAPGAPSGSVLLGPQPAEGFRLDPELVKRLGGPGATVTAVDAEDDTLQAKFLIGAPR